MQKQVSVVVGIMMVAYWCLKGPYFSFVRSDPDTTWNVNDMETALNVCRCKLPPRCRGDGLDSQPHRIYVLFKAPPQSSHTDSEGKYIALFGGDCYFVCSDLSLLRGVVRYSDGVDKSIEKNSGVVFLI